MYSSLKVAVVAFDREDFAQQRFKPFVLSLGGLDLLLEEALVRLDLNLESGLESAARRRAC